MGLRYPDLKVKDGFGDFINLVSDTILQIPPEHAGSPAAVHNPIHGGCYVSSAAEPCCMGTLSGIVTKNGLPYLLSNAHVFFNANDSVGKAGQKVYQPPSGYSGSRTVGLTLARKRPEGTRFKWGTTPSQTFLNNAPTYYDAGLSTVKVKYDFNIPKVGVPTGHTEPRKGMKVILAGARSGVDTGVITSASTNITIHDTGSPYGFFAKNVFQHDCNSTHGDSGAMVVEIATKKVVGLHFAGNDQSPKENFAVKASAIVNALGISFKGKAGTFNPPTGYTTPPPVTCNPPKHLVNGVCVSPTVCNPPNHLVNGICTPPVVRPPLVIPPTIMLAGGVFAGLLVLAVITGG